MSAKETAPTLSSSHTPPSSELAGVERRISTTLPLKSTAKSIPANITQQCRTAG